MRSSFDIVIVGAGITGLATAAMLARAGRQTITVVDAAGPPAAPANEWSLRVSAIASGSQALLQQVGAWQRIDCARICAYEHMRVWDESLPADGPATLRFDAAEFAVPELGCIVENDLIRHALYSVLEHEQITWMFDAGISALEREEGGYRLDVAGHSLQADLVIAADGARSAVRELAGIDTRERPYGQTAFVTHLQPERPHRNTAWQRFLVDGPLGMLPLADGRISVVWSTTEAVAQVALDASDKQLGEMLTEASDGVLGRLEAAGPRGSFPLCARHAREYVRPGLALIGDAAHAIHPLAGQGANLGLQDAAALTRVISAAFERGAYPADRPVLRRYERERKGANATMLEFMTTLNRLFGMDAVAPRALRTTGMRLFNNSGPLRDYMVGVALGAGR